MYAYLKTLVQWRRFIFLSGIAAAVIAAVISLLLPKWYTATTSIFPPETKASLSPYAQILQGLQSPLLGPMALGARPGTIYIDILKSRTVGERVIEEFGFKEIYKTDLITDALDMLSSHMSFSLFDNGLLIISFEDRNAERAARVTNRLVTILDEFNRQLNTGRAGRSRQFIEGQLERHKEELTQAEDKLKAFQEKNQAVEMDEQTRATIEIIGDLTSEAIKLEIELDVLKDYASTASEEYRTKKEHYDKLMEQLNKFKVDSSRTAGDITQSYFPTLDRVPQISMDYARLLRDVKVGEKVYQMLVTEYEQARIDEARDTPTIQILDSASPPELRSRPKRKRIVIIGGFLGVAWGGVIAIFSTFLSGGSSQADRLKELVSPVSHDLKRLFRRSRQ
jgi:tyrosine-protein kinase Etk/Wzc